METNESLIFKKQQMKEEAIRNRGFYGNNGVWNSIITFPNDDRLYRERVETIVVRNGKEVFLKKKPNGEYFLPGGSTERDLPDIDQAINECKEEARINVGRIESTGISYKERHEVPSWTKNECVVEWQGTFTKVYVGEYESKYRGKIDKEDTDPFILSGKWYPTKECFKFFRKEHRDALLMYLRNIEMEKENNLVTESYISNYFKNLRLVKRFSDKPEFNKKAIIELAKTLQKEYKKRANSKMVKEIKKKGEVKSYFFPCNTIKFGDGREITVSLCFDEEEFSEGCAFRTEKYGDIVAIYPCFFKTSVENQVFVILHEIGHIRLGHVDPKNCKYDIFGMLTTSDYRHRKMRKGRAMYTEINADLYAALHGASMYEIIGIAPNMDYDDRFDYRFTTAELCARYNSVFRKYIKLRGYGVEPVTENKYDAICDVIQELVYENHKLNFLTDSDKDELSTILYEYTIDQKIKSNEEIKILTENYDLQLRSLSENLNCYSKSLSNVNENTDDMNTIISNLKIKGLTPTVVRESMFNLENAYNDLYEMNVKILEESCEINTESKKEIKNNILCMVDSMLNKLTLKQESDINNFKLDHYIYILESLSKSERARIPEDRFGIPELKKYPLDTKKHVRSAVILFGKSEKKYRKELAERIFQAMEEFGISFDMIGPKSELYKYLPDDKRK